MQRGMVAGLATGLVAGLRRLRRRLWGSVAKPRPLDAGAGVHGVWVALVLLCVGVLGAAGQGAQRIVSTAPSITETLFALGLGPRVVGVSQYCEWPAEVKALPKVGTYVQPNAEAIVRLRPDLVLGEQASNEVAERLRQFGIRFVEVPHGSLAETYAGIGVIAAAAGVPDRGAALVGRLRAGLSAIRTRAARAGKVRVVMIVDRRPGTLEDLIATGPGNYENELIEAAGGINVLARPGMMVYPRISLETVLRENPDVIVDLTDAHDAGSQQATVRLTDRAMWMRQGALQAVRGGRVYLADSSVFLVPGPRMVEAAERLFAAFHPEFATATHGTGTAR